MIAISQTKGRPLAVMVVEAMRIMMDSLPWEEGRRLSALGRGWNRLEDLFKKASAQNGRNSDPRKSM